MYLSVVVCTMTMKKQQQAKVNVIPRESVLPSSDPLLTRGWSVWHTAKRAGEATTKVNVKGAPSKVGGIYEWGISKGAGGAIIPVYVGKTDAKGGLSARLARYGYKDSHKRELFDAYSAAGYALHFRVHPTVGVDTRRSTVLSRAEQLESFLLKRYDYAANKQKNTHNKKAKKPRPVAGAPDVDVEGAIVRRRANRLSAKAKRLARAMKKAELVSMVEAIVSPRKPDPIPEPPPPPPPPPRCDAPSEEVLPPPPPLKPRRRRRPRIINCAECIRSSSPESVTRDTLMIMSAILLFIMYVYTTMRSKGSFVRAP